MELRISSLLALILLWDSLCVSGFISKTAAQSDIYQRNSEHSLETLGQIKHLQVRPENSVYIHPGQTLTLQCGDEGDEVQTQWWQTPFGLFDGCKHPNTKTDPVETCNGTLRISRATSSHDGLYYCVRLDKMSRTIVPYRVNIVAVKKLRKTREAKVNSNTVSESHFAAAVASSVIVSFVVAFTLGAFSRSYVIKCLRTIRARVPCGKDQHSHINEQNVQTSRAQTETVLFNENQDTGEDTVDVGLVDQEPVDNADAVENGNGNDEASEPQSCEGEEQTQEMRSVVSPHPKKKTRIIKLYNYDEEGNPYSHIKDSDRAQTMEVANEVRPKLRTTSLTRLDAIMKQAESLEFNQSRESTEGQKVQLDAPSHENSVSATGGDTGDSQSS
ncbi:hypothetical protein QQF64_012732 [Cirrhinus molitorella]|uniref:Ig-like domain-containing protein n=1 Tax=Cirrhinus molitorella TaxID=172907 RepID=A0ABR3LZY4_9TELE